MRDMENIAFSRLGVRPYARMIETVVLLLQNGYSHSIARLAILASFPLLPHFGNILAPSVPILMAIALQTSCILRASSIDLRKSGNAVFYHS